MENPPQPPTDGIADDFFEQIFSMPGYATGDGHSVPEIVSQFNSGDCSAAGSFPVFPLSLSLDQGRPSFALAEDGSGGAGVGKRLREAAVGKTSSEEGDPVQLTSLFPAFERVQSNQIRPNPPQILHGQSLQASIAPAALLQAPRPRVRARRGQATDPHSIAERLRRERIAERMRALQELVPYTNKTDRAAMLDEIVDYVKFLRLQVKVLSMSRLGGAGAVAQLVADVPLSQAEGDSISDGRSKQQVWESWSTEGTEHQVAKLMEEDVGAAMQFLQSKALCLMPISLASAIYHTLHQPDNPSVKPEPNTPPS